MATCFASAYLPLHTAVIPLPIEQGVLGMARTTGMFSGRALSIIDVGTDAATEMISWAGVICPRISRMTSCTTCGFTAMRTMSAPLTAAALSVPTLTFSFAASDFARSSCCTVAQVSSGESRLFFEQRLQNDSTHLAGAQHRDSHLAEFGFHNFASAESGTIHAANTDSNESLQDACSGAAALHPVPGGGDRFS